MFLGGDNVRTQLEWNALLSTENAPSPSAETKFWRKVCCVSPPPRCRADERADVDHRDHWCGKMQEKAGRWTDRSFSGPKTNSVQKLGELRAAGVNVGA